MRQQNDKIRSKFLFLHRWLGIISGTIVFFVAITGSLFVFEEEARDIFQKKYLYVDAPNQGKKLSMDILLSKFSDAHPNEKITQIRANESANGALIIHTQSDKAISINPYNGLIIGERDMEGDFFEFIEHSHKSLLLGDFGEGIIKANVLIFFFMCISGLVIWWPKKNISIKQAATINVKSKNWKGVSWSLHSVLGFYASFILLIISLCGIFMTYDTAKQLVSTVTNSPIKSKAGPNNTSEKPGEITNISKCYNEASQMYPGAVYTIVSIGRKPNQPIKVMLEYPYTLLRNENNIYFDKYTGDIIEKHLSKDFTGYDIVAKNNLNFHTGRIAFLGIGSKIIYFLAAIFAASLPITGFMVWWGKR